jgi:hypothetical protein
VTTSGTGSYNNASTSNYWLGNASYQGGNWRTASQTSTTPFRDGSGGNYAGKSADDGDNSGGTTNWGGVGNPGGMGWSATSTNCSIYVFKSGVWTQCNVYVMKSGTWTITTVNIMKSSVWTPLNQATIPWLQRDYREGLPSTGVPVMVSVDGGALERGYLVEEGVGWFGTIDPTAIGNPGLGCHPDVFYPAPFTGRYNSREPEEVADARLFAYDQWQRALAADDMRAAAYWRAMFQPELLPTMRTFAMNAVELNGTLTPLARQNSIITEEIGGVSNLLATRSTLGRARAR